MVTFTGSRSPQTQRAIGFSDRLGRVWCLRPLESMIQSTFEQHVCFRVADNLTVQGQVTEKCNQLIYDRYKEAALPIYLRSTMVFWKRAQPTLGGHPFRPPGAKRTNYHLPPRPPKSTFATKRQLSLQTKLSFECTAPRFQHTLDGPSRPKAKKTQKGPKYPRFGNEQGGHAECESRKKLRMLCNNIT